MLIAYFETIMFVILVISIFIVISLLLQNLKFKSTIKSLKIENDREKEWIDDIRAFRHDFANIIQSIGGYIYVKDFYGLKKMYEDIIKELNDIDNLSSINPSTINNPAIYNLINCKYNKAKKYGINIKITCLIDLNKLNTDDYKICRILGILLDNAIEATKKCEDKFIEIKFLNDEISNRDLIIIENSYNNYCMDVNQLFKRGVTTKKDKKNHGLGLWIVNKIIKDSNNLSIFTSKDSLFKQQLAIQKKVS